MYKVGDYIVYSKRGVCKILEIGPVEDSGMDDEFYTIEPVFDRGTIFVPLGMTDQLRPVMTADEAMEVIMHIPDVPIRDVNLHRPYDIKNALASKISSINLDDLIEVLKIINRKRINAESTGKQLSTTDLNYLGQAEKLFYGELAIALGMDIGEVHEFVIEKTGGHHDI
ncbi:MAG: hypothetical protein MJ145_04320 [Clostridia bacterium]|nr:hypothetical protein [Clostridia bacterium]